MKERLTEYKTVYPKSYKTINTQSAQSSLETEVF